MGSLPNDSVFIGSRELKGKLAPVNTDENSFSGYLAANSGCRVMGDVEADADTCRILIEEGSTKLQAACSMRATRAGVAKTSRLPLFMAFAVFVCMTMTVASAAEPIRNSVITIHFFLQCF